jgi:hypothetical protein
VHGLPSLNPSRATYYRMSKRIVILSTATRAGDGPAWGLGQDAKLVEQVLRESHASGHFNVASVDHIDPVSFYGSARRPKQVDLQIHLERPCRAAMIWAPINIIIVNPEWWPATAWDWALESKERGGIDMFIFKSAHARSLFPSIDNKRCRVLTWRAGTEIQEALATLSKTPARREFLYLVGASVNKLAAAKTIVSAWKPTWPSLTVVGSEGVCDALRPLVVCDNVIIRAPFIKGSDRVAAQAAYGYHVVASEAEGFGYTFAESSAVGALPLWSAIPVYEEFWGSVVGDIGKISTMPPASLPSAAACRDSPRGLDAASIAKAVESLLGLTAGEETKLRGALKHAATVRIKAYRHDWRALLGSISRTRTAELTPMPPRLLPVAELPHVAVVTLTRNRPQWFNNMARNILLSEYPPDKLTWIVADDGEGVGRIDESIMKFQTKNPRIHVIYLSMPKPLPIGAKRNKACAAAPASADIFVMMDDDDHYPTVSIPARVAWLKSTGVDCVYCSTLPMYDCKRYISAINVPPLTLSPAERISEASLCFKRSFWADCGFPAGVSVAEGEGFIEGRVHQTAEIPPEGVIVSFLHGGNATSRRVPESSEANGCHFGFDDEYFSYISGLAV